ncbi:MAG: beta-ketoacyl-[acyl-carrier-protein] synthase family protein [Chloroflexi bacterium]|nr:beta-ketoacyl-[acyl-carrier-protein] synthase family protein [Chloroflexota bacterium]
MDRSITVTGMGVVSSIGNDTNTFWNNLLLGKSGITRLSNLDTSSMSTKIGAEVDSRWLLGSFTRKEVKRTSRVSLMALKAARQALEQAKLYESEYLTNTAVLIGCSQGGFVESEVFFEKGLIMDKVSPFGILKPMNSAPATNITIKHKIRGPSLTIDTACSSANHAIGLATQLIKSGMVDIALVGGVDTPFSPVIFKSWCTIGVLSTKNSDPEKACKPFSRNRDGTVFGEGAGILILEEEEHAIKRGVQPIARIKGYGASSDASHIALPHAEGMIKSISRALKNAKISPEDVDYINAHGTGTWSNDPTETHAIKTAFGPYAYEVPINGIKPNLGHTLAASASFEAIACVMSLDSGMVPSMLNYEEPDPECDLNYFVTQSEELKPEICMSLSLAFGGSNSVIIFEKY